jgi:hypothetical protein
MLRNIIIVAKTDKNDDVIIVLNNWSFLAMGEGHIVLQNSCKNDDLYWNVMAICMHEM